MMEKEISASERRAAAVAARKAETGIDEDMLRRLVDTFYARIRSDGVLGPIFEERIDDWDHHLEKLTAFWCCVALGTGTYAGSPMRKHLPLPIDSRHFDRWLILFRRTAQDVCGSSIADYLLERAFRIAQSLEMALSVDQGVMLAPQERFLRPDLDVDAETGNDGRRQF